MRPWADAASRRTGDAAANAARRLGECSAHRAVPASRGRRGPHAGVVRVALLAESFLPHMNGVTHSLLQVLRHLERRGHEALVIAPESGPDRPALHGARTVLLRRSRCRAIPTCG